MNNRLLIAAVVAAAIALVAFPLEYAAYSAGLLSGNAAAAALGIGVGVALAFAIVYLRRRS